MTRKKNACKKDVIWFLCSALTIPAIQFIIFYFVVNINSVTLSFQEWTGTDYAFAGWANYKNLIKEIFNEKSWAIMFKNTFVMYFVMEILMLFITTIISYAIWKRVLGHGFFSVMLFLPSIISNVVFILAFRMFVMNGLPKIFNDPKSAELLTRLDTSFDALLVFSTFLSAGTKVILLSGAMSGVNSSVVEYSELDGMNAYHQFIYIVFPHIYPSIISLFMMGCATIFSNMGALLSYWGTSPAGPEVKTIGYHIYLSLDATVQKEAVFRNYNTVSALGILLTLVVVVYSFVSKKLLVKFGPSED